VGLDGQPLASTDYTVVSGRWALKVLRNGSWVKVRELNDLDEIPTLAGLGRDGRSPLIRSLDDGARAYREVSVDAAAWGDPVPAPVGAEPILDPQSRRLMGFASVQGGVRKAELLDAHDQAIWNAVTAAYPGDQVDIVSWSGDRQKLVARVDSPTTGPAYALVDLGARASTWIGDAYPELKAADISDVRPVEFAARDGLKLTGFVTLPRTRVAANLPLVVLPHPGPDSRDDPGFNWWAQALASRGYAVLQLNYRGSDGQGAELLKAGYGEWGRKMQSDLADGVAEMARRGLVDARRVCLVGEDYGGYAALAGMTLEPGRYRCGAAIGGISDPGRLIAWIRNEKGASALRGWARYLGADDKDAPSLKAISPLAHAAEASGPILLIHGEDDVVVPYAQSVTMARALEAAGKRAEFLTLPDEDHWLTNGATRRLALAGVVAFLEKNNPPQ
jgi:dipeptidyl aminopeptidase/acylaminoacyl peptidase